MDIRNDTQYIRRIVKKLVTDYRGSSTLKLHTCRDNHNKQISLIQQDIRYIVCQDYRYK